MTNTTEEAPIPRHPGEILLNEYMKPNGISIDELATRASILKHQLKHIVLGVHGIRKNTAIKLGIVFRTGAMYWLNLQGEYDIYHAQKAMAPELIEALEEFANQLQKEKV